MNKKLQEYMEHSFDPAAVAEANIKWIRDWFEINGKGATAVIGLSGGKDSTVVATLCVKALGADRVFGVLMPDHKQSDIDVSMGVAAWLGIKHAVVDVGAATDGVKAGLASADMYDREACAIDEKLGETKQMLVNIAPRVRMTTLYAVAATMNGRVSNNSNRSERYVGYSTIFGDGVGDFSPLANLTVTEVVSIGEYLGVPDEYIHKAPSDGLTGKTDEDNFGFTYEELDTLILTGTCENEQVKQLIEERHRNNSFKLKPMPMFMKEME